MGAWPRLTLLRPHPPPHLRGRVLSTGAGWWCWEGIPGHRGRNAILETLKAWWGWETQGRSHSHCQTLVPMCPGAGGRALQAQD